MKTFSIFVLSWLLLAAQASAAVITVPAGGNARDAITKAVPGDEIILAAGATYDLQMDLPAKPGLPVTIRSSGILPDRRVTPADRPLMATLRSGVGVNGAVFTCGPGCNYKLVGVHITPSPTFIGGEAVIIEGGTIAFEKVLILTPGGDIKRGIRANGPNISVVDSHIGDIWTAGQDSQAICQWWGSGLRVVNTYAGAASENILIGGADSPTAAQMPSDILIEGNTLSKPLEWKGQSRQVKILLELKAARNVQIRNNILENNWVEAQVGYAVVLTPRNQDWTAPWSRLEDVLIERNVIRNTVGGFNVTGVDDLAASGRTNRVTIRHNLVINSGDKAILLGGEIGALDISHNTIINSGTAVYFYKGDVWPAAENRTSTRPGRYAVETFTYRDNLAYHRAYGFHGADAPVGPGAITMHVLNPIVWGTNVLAGTENAGLAYPAVTLRPTEAAHAAQFNPDYSLVVGSVYRGAGTGGSDLGWGGANVVIPPPVPAPVPDSDATALELVKVKAELAALKADLADLVLYLQKTPTSTRIAQVVAYLRGVGK